MVQERENSRILKKNNWFNFNRFFENNPYRQLNNLSEEKEEENNNYQVPESVIKAIPVPELCERCTFKKPNIRVKDKNLGTLEFICYDCRSKDEKLKNVYVKPY